MKKKINNRIGNRFEQINQTALNLKIELETELGEKFSDAKFVAEQFCSKTINDKINGPDGIIQRFDNELVKLRSIWILLFLINLFRSLF